MFGEFNDNKINILMISDNSVIDYARILLFVFACLFFTGKSSFLAPTAIPELVVVVV